MMNNINFSITLIFLMFLFGGCSSNSGEKQSEDIAGIRESLAQTNKILLSSEDQEIRDFIERYGWPMQETGSGLRYWIFQQGNGNQVKQNNIVRISYQIHLLSGDQVYSSEEEGPKEFKVGQGGVESGLEEAILLMKQGDRAKFIMPAHLAHGLPGDGIKIPRRAAIVYDVELLELK
jgi:FKBP-type peptidyl-prolyl cis-trans isomerase FkpA